MYYIMKVISFDIGIKNMSYCLFDISGSTSRIIDWKVLSMLNEDSQIVYCNSPAVKITKKTQINNFFTAGSNNNQNIKLCGRIAKYKKGSNCFCEKHAKSQKTYYLPSSKKIGKMSLKELSSYATDSLFIHSELPKKKSDLLSMVENHLKENGLDLIHAKKSPNASDTDLIVIGKNMKRIFQNVLAGHSDISHVLIENQISPLANRMKTIQGMVTQYFIMMYDSISIEFVSSINKLKLFTKHKRENEKQTENEEVHQEVHQEVHPEQHKNSEPLSKDTRTQSQKYKQHKKDGIIYCEQVLASGKWNQEIWINCEKTKKDDLADCFLQGIWWLKKQNLIDAL